MSASDPRLATGTTADAYPGVPQLQVINASNLVYFIKNTHAANGLTFKVEGVLVDNGQAITIKGDTAVAGLASSTDSVQNLIAAYRDAVFRQINVYLKSTVGATPATFEVDTNAKCIDKRGGN
jgi:subtilase family serine protease